MMKKCNKCDIEKPLDAFDKDKRRSDGHVSQCIECRKHYLKERRKNNHKVLETEKKYKQKNLEKITSYQKEYRDKNADSNKEYNKQYRKNNINKLVDYKKLWDKDNKEKLSDNTKRFRQTEKGKEYMYRKNIKRRSYKHDVAFKPHQRLELLKRDNWTCKCCGVRVHNETRNDKLKAHIDHIIPISKGGTSEPDNLQVLCRTCNLSKSNKLVIKEM